MPSINSQTNKNSSTNINLENSAFRFSNIRLTSLSPKPLQHPQQRWKAPFISSDSSSLRHDAIYPGATWFWASMPKYIDWYCHWLTLIDVYWCWLMLVYSVGLWLMLIYAGWRWPMLIDVDWCWLMVIDAAAVTPSSNTRSYTRRNVPSPLGR